jgi:hypothetical protein
LPHSEQYLSDDCLLHLPTSSEEEDEEEKVEEEDDDDEVVILSCIASPDGN